MNTLLAICIPTYNRANHLYDCIEKLIPQLLIYKIPIYVSDNDSNDNTAELIEKLQKEYPLISYSKNPKNMGADYNFTKVLKMSNNKYSWLLGDDDRIEDGIIDKFMLLIKDHDYDAIIVNGGYQKKMEKISRVNNIPSKVYCDPNSLLSDLGWHMTWMSCLIFSRAMIDEVIHEKYYNTNFLQFAIIFDYLAGKKCSVYWLSEWCVYGASTGAAAWRKDTFKIFANSWYNVVSNLPQKYTSEVKRKCILDHGVKSNLFNFRSLKHLRGDNVLNLTVFRENIEYLPFTIKLPMAIVFIIAIFPIKFIRFNRAISKFLKSLRQGKW